MFIADTNNHRIRVYDFKSKELKTLEMTGLTVPAPAPAASEETAVAAATAPAQTIVSGPQLQFKVDLNIPEGFKLNPLGTVNFQLKADGPQTLVAEEHLGVREELDAKTNQVEFQVPLAGKTGTGRFQLTLSYLYCKQDQTGGVCKMKRSTWLIPVTVAATGAKAIELDVE